MDLILKNIGRIYGILDSGVSRLKGKEMARVNEMTDAWLMIRHGKIEDFGSMETFTPPEQVETVDLEGKTLMPGLIDSHTHIIFAKTREEEFRMKIEGADYAEIAAKGGGILNSARAMKEASEKQLLEDALERVHAMIKTGTVAFEVKSGYGLSVESELKMLRVAATLKKKLSLPVKITLLGAHALPDEFKANRQAYINMVMKELIPEVAKYKLADYIDVFCENNFFTPGETDLILKAGAAYGLKAKIHANQLAVSGGVQVGVKNHALSVDHLENIGEEEILCLQNSETLPVALPGCSFYLKMNYTPGRKLIDSGLPLVLASDFNPGSSPSGNLLFVWSLACIQMRLLPEEAFNALTINAAAALELEKELGSITKGKSASLMVFKKGTNLSHIPYHFAQLLPESMMIEGKWVK